MQRIVCQALVTWTSSVLRRERRARQKLKRTWLRGPSVCLWPCILLRLICRLTPADVHVKHMPCQVPLVSPVACALNCMRMPHVVHAGTLRVTVRAGTSVNACSRNARNGWSQSGLTAISHSQARNPKHCVGISHTGTFCMGRNKYQPHFFNALMFEAAGQEVPSSEIDVHSLYLA